MNYYLSIPFFENCSINVNFHVPLKQKDEPVELFKALMHRLRISNKFLSEGNKRIIQNIEIFVSRFYENGKVNILVKLMKRKFLKINAFGKWWNYFFFDNVASNKSFSFVENERIPYNKKEYFLL